MKEIDQYNPLERDQRDSISFYSEEDIPFLEEEIVNYEEEIETIIIDDDDEENPNTEEPIVCIDLTTPDLPELEELAQTVPDVVVVSSEEETFNDDSDDELFKFFTPEVLAKHREERKRTNTKHFFTQTLITACIDKIYGILGEIKTETDAMIKKRDLRDAQKKRDEEEANKK